MTSLRDPFSVARQAQFEAQFDFFHTVTSQAFDSAGRVAALNLAASRDAAQRSLGATFALLNSRDPRDLLTLGGQAEEGMRSLFAYSRELLGIASGVRPSAARPQALARTQPIDTVDVTEAVSPAPAQPAPEPASAEPVVVVEAEAAPQAEAPAAVEPAPVAEPTPIAAAVAQGEVHAAVAPHPAAAPVPEIGEVALPKVELPRASSKRKK